MPTSPTDETDESCGEGCATTDAATSVGFVGEPGGHISADALAARIARLPCPDNFPIHHWRRLHAGACKFARSEWPAKTIEAGWTIDELFKIVEPFCNVAWQGAAWCIGDSNVMAVSADAITLRSPVGSVTRIYRAPHPNGGFSAENIVGGR
jgi:hypothetical protein